jgi:cell division protein FtsL
MDVTGKRKEVNKMKKIEKLFIIITIVFFVYLLISFIDVNLHNNAAETAKEIANWNFFKILFD